MVFLGNHRFDEMVRRTGAPRDTLAARLRSLTGAGILERRQYSVHPARHEYRLTEAGRELYPVILTLMRWGDEHRAGDDGPPMVIEHACGHRLVATVVCRACGQPAFDPAWRGRAATTPARLQALGRLGDAAGHAAPGMRGHAAKSADGAGPGHPRRPGIIEVMNKSRSPRFPVAVTHLPVTRCQICDRTVAYRPGTISEVLTEHYRRAHPETLRAPLALAGRRAPRRPRPRRLGGGSNTAGGSAVGRDGARESGYWMVAARLVRP